MDIESGWVFYSADFSRTAGDDTREGRATIIRIPADVKRWSEIVAGIDSEEPDDWPELYAQGRGLTIEQAIINANLIASHLPALI